MSGGGGQESVQLVRPPFRLRLAMAVPRPAAIIGLGVFWGFAMAISAFAALFLRVRFDIVTPVPIIALFFCGGAFAAPVACFIARLIPGHQNRRLPGLIVSFIVFSALLALGTMAMTAFLFAMQYRLYYSQFHEPFGTITWFFQFAYTSASAVYQFAIFGSKLYWPLAPVFLLVFSLWFVRRPH